MLTEQNLNILPRETVSILPQDKSLRDKSAENTESIISIDLSTTASTSTIENEKVSGAKCECDNSCIPPGKAESSDECASDRELHPDLNAFVIPSVRYKGRNFHAKHTERVR